ncbi:hypothetical protein OFY17_10250 [Marinomonas sp. C2222]|uniref:DUF2846 domain-containing protein n=1 Tax=Marinomonas sargassi TaxID=2984494 RepID=A0ABT2YTN6_9GAMM|nr:hypothetical protein [Marinomonas sargassi]MCV2403260.1 hypothetical protein [Marinomonas sargassi]
MKKLIGILVGMFSVSAVAVEGYKDIYLNKAEDIIVHGIFCGADINQLNRFKPSVVYTNTAEIEKGTYYFRSPYGDYSFTFNSTQNDLVMVRGLSQGGASSIEDMKQEFCIVKYDERLPSGVKQYVNQKVIKENAPDKTKVLEQYELVSGKPAVGKGKY